MKAGRKPEYPEKIPGDELQKMPHIKARIFKLQVRLELAQCRWWQDRKADVLTVTPRVGPILPGSPNTDPVIPGAWQGSHHGTNVGSI